MERNYYRNLKITKKKKQLNHNLENLKHQQMMKFSNLIKK